MRSRSWSQGRCTLTPQDVAIEAGKQDFARFGCAGCHGTELQGGAPNPNAQGGEVPSLLHVSDDYTKDEVITHHSQWAECLPWIMPPARLRRSTCRRGNIS